MYDSSMGMRKCERSVRVRSRKPYADRESCTEGGMEARSEEAVQVGRGSEYRAARWGLFLIAS